MDSIRVRVLCVRGSWKEESLCVKQIGCVPGVKVRRRLKGAEEARTREWNKACVELCE